MMDEHSDEEAEAFCVDGPCDVDGSEDVEDVLENDRAAESAPPPSSCSPASVLALALTAVVAGAGYLFLGDDSPSTVGPSSASTSPIEPSHATPWEDREGRLTQCPELSALAGEAGQCATSRSSRASDILQAQQLLQVLPPTNINDDVDSPAFATDQASMTPAWVVRRDPSFGLWLWPRLKLVLFACPKCGNSKVRTLLNQASAEVQKTEEEDSMATRPPGGWAKESDHSWQARSPIIGPGKNQSNKNLLTFEQNDEAYQYIDELLSDRQWSSLGVIRHPYGRLSSGFSELELRWGDYARNPEQYPGQQFSLGVLDDRTSFWHQEIETPDRALAFWTDYIAGNFYFSDPASHCLIPVAEAYHLSPVGSFFLKDSSDCEASSLYTVDHTIDIDELSRDWPNFIQHWADNWDAEVAEKLANKASEHGNSHAGSTNTLIMKQLLKDNAEFRESVDAFYSHDFSHFGFDKDPAIIGRLR